MSLINQGCMLDAVIRNEHLEDDLLKALLFCGVSLNQNDVALIHSGSRTNASQRKRDLAFYYDDETRNFVHDRDKILVSKYDYTEPKSEHG